MAVGSAPGSINIASASYNYDSFGNVLAHSLGSVDATLAQSGTFTYDSQNRVTSGYGQGFGWEANGNFTSFAGAIYGYSTGQQPHAVDTVNGADLFDYNANGSMSVRNKGTTGQQTLRWDSRNQLAQVTWGSPVRNEYYGYDEGGRRVARAAVQNGVTTVTFYPFAHYEQTGSSGAGVIKYYFFGGERVAMRTGSGAGTLRLLFKDRLSSTVHVTDGAGNQVAGRGYYAFGATMRSTGTMPTDHLFTDQQQDATGLYYYGARYYEPTIGHFISPDTIVPDPTNVMDYQRYMYVRGNPLKYNDPSGRDPLDAAWQREFRSVHKREPTAEDITIRLYSVAFPNSWNWSNFYNENGLYIDGSVQNFLGPSSQLTWDGIPNALTSLAGWYQDNENMEFVRDVGVLFGGLFNRNEAPGTWQAVTGEGAENYPARQWVYVRLGNMHPNYLDSDPDSNIHHWAWGIVLGSSQYGYFGYTINQARESEQLRSGGNWSRDALRNYLADVRIGNAGVRLGQSWSQKSMGRIVSDLNQDIAIAFLVNR